MEYWHWIIVAFNAAILLLGLFFLGYVRGISYAVEQALASKK